MAVFETSHVKGKTPNCTSVSSEQLTGVKAGYPTVNFMNLENRVTGSFSEILFMFLTEREMNSFLSLMVQYLNLFPLFNIWTHVQGCSNIMADVCCEG